MKFMSFPNKSIIPAPFQVSADVVEGSGSYRNLLSTNLLKIVDRCWNGTTIKRLIFHKK